MSFNGKACCTITDDWAAMCDMFVRFYRAAGWRLDGAGRRRAFLGTQLLEWRHRRL
jgi:hypothetical protein